jgi:hypothetical protein
VGAVKCSYQSSNLKAFDGSVQNDEHLKCAPVFGISGHNANIEEHFP